MNNAGKYLRILLWLTALHSFTVACALIFLGNSGIVYFGFPEGNQFFQVQGGVFHLVMCIAYLLAARDINNSGLLCFIISAKTLAALYLLAYYLLVYPILAVLMAGLADGAMALLIWVFWRSSKRYSDHE